MITSDKVLTPAEVASIKARRFAGDMPKVLDSHEALRVELEKSDQDWQDYMSTIRLNIPAEFTKQPQLDLCMQRMKEEITRLRGLIEGMGHEEKCASRRFREVHEEIPNDWPDDEPWYGMTTNVSLGLGCNCILSKVNL